MASDEPQGPPNPPESFSYSMGGFKCGHAPKRAAPQPDTLESEQWHPDLVGKVVSEKVNGRSFKFGALYAEYVLPEGTFLYTRPTGDTAPQPDTVEQDGLKHCACLFDGSGKLVKECIYHQARSAQPDTVAVDERAEFTDRFARATQKAEENGFGQDDEHKDDSWIDDLGRALDEYRTWQARALLDQEK